MRIEFLRAWEDHTWDTEVIEVPSITCDVDNGVDFDDEVTVDGNLICWANRILSPQEKYRKVVMFAVYSTDPEESNGREGLVEGQEDQVQRAQADDARDQG